MARAAGLSGVVEGFALAERAQNQGRDIGLRFAAMEMERQRHEQLLLNESMKRAAGVADYIMTDPKTGMKDPSRLASPVGAQALSALIKQDPVFARAFESAFTQGSEAERQGLRRVPVGFEPVRDATGTVVPGRVALRVQWQDDEGNVISEGPMTANGTNRDDDQVVLLDGKMLQEGFLGLVSAYSPELRQSLQESWQLGADRRALRTVSDIRPQEQRTVVRPARPAPATSAPGTAGAAPAPTDAVAEAESTAPTPAPTQSAELAPEDAARFTRVRERLNNELRAAGEQLAKLSAPPADANHQGARRAKYEQDVQAAQQKIAQLSTQYQELHQKFGVPLNAAPATVAPEQLPQVQTEQPRLEAAAQTPPAQAAPKLQALETVTTKRGAPKLTEEQKDAVAWLAARKIITPEQYDRVMRTGRLSQSDKKMLGDGLGGLWVRDEQGNISHIKGPYTDALLAAKTSGKAKDPLDVASKQAKFIEDNYRFLAMRPGRKGGPDHLDAQRFNQVRDSMLVSAASLGFNPYTPEAVTMVNKAKELQDAWARENGPAWTNLWLKDEANFNSYTPGIIAAKFGKDMDTVMNQYYAPLRALLGDQANQVPGHLMDGFAQVVAGLEARNVPYEQALRAATLVLQQGGAGAFAAPHRLLNAAFSDGN